MRGPREVPCNGCNVTYTPGGRACSSACAELMQRRAAARTVSTPETRAAEDRWAGFGSSSAPLPVAPPKNWEAVEVEPKLVMSAAGPVGFVRQYEARETLPTLDPADLPPVNRHEAANRLAFLAVGNELSDNAVRELLATAERLKGAA